MCQFQDCEYWCNRSGSDYKMSPTPIFPKIVIATFTDAATDDPVTILNTRTKEKVTTDRKSGAIFRLESKDKSLVFDTNNFLKGFLVDDILSFSLGGARACTGTVTLTVAKNAPQRVTISTTAVNTAVISI